MIVQAIRTRRIRCRPALVRTRLGLSGGYWFVRNWIVEGNPTPWWTLRLGPIHLDATLAGGATIRAVPRRRRRVAALRPAWICTTASDGCGQSPSCLGVIRGRVRGAALQRRTPAFRLAGVTVLLGLVGYVYTRTQRRSRRRRVRVHAAVPGHRAVHRLSPCWRSPSTGRRLPGRGRTVSIALLVLVVANAPLHQFDGLEAWPSEGVVPAVVAGARRLSPSVCCTAGRSTPLAHRRRALRPPRHPWSWSPRSPAWFVERHYLDHRYVDAGLDLDYIDAALHDRAPRTHRRLRIGTALSDVRHRPVQRRNQGERAGHTRLLGVGGRSSPTAGSPTSCSATAVASRSAAAPDPSDLVTDPAVQVVATDGSSGLYRITGPLDPTRCP